MSSEMLLTGEDLEQIYREDKSNDLLKDQKNLKKLLNYALNKKDTIDSNFDMEIIDFCVDGLSEEITIDEERIAFMKEKQEFIAREKEKKRRFYSFGKVAAAAAVFVVVIGIAVFGSVSESEAGVFDWIRSLIVKEDNDTGEQLSISSSDTTLMSIEQEEGHLPDCLPEEFVYEQFYILEGPISTKKMYIFVDTTTNKDLMIQIITFIDEQALINMEVEINKNASEMITDNNISYYYTQNNTRNSISWIYNKQFYIIEGDFSVETLDEILTFYKKEQN